MKMNKYILLFATTVIGLFSACDYNDKFDGLDDLSKPSNIIKDSLTVSNEDIATIVKALYANKNANDSTMAKTLNTDKMFSAAAPAKTLVPYLLKAKYYSADITSSVDVSYQYKEGRDSIVSGLSTKTYVIAEDDYKSVWGDLFVSAFTPTKSAEKNIPTILNSHFKDAKKGTFQNVEYFYSQEEPTDATVEDKFFFEDFETLEAKKDVTLTGWINKDVLSTRTWQGQSYSGNLYAQASSNKSGNKNDIWLITPSIDLTSSTKPQFSFDVNVRYFNGECLSVLISENFDGNAANITKATWKNVSTSFNIPASDMTAIGTAGTMDIAAYKGKKIHIAFRYQGDDSSADKKTTTYQVDNVKVFESKPGIAVKDKALLYAAYECMGDGKWQAAAKSVITLQPADYETMGITYLATAEAPKYLPKYLSTKFIYAQEGDKKVIVYKTSKTNNYADEYAYKNGKWSPNSFIVTKTEKFARSSAGWALDPTFRDELQKGKGEADGYMMVVNYVKVHQAVSNPALINSYGDTEYYYGFSGNHGNVSYRDKDRSLDTAYPSAGSIEEKAAFMNQRTIEGVALYLSLKYPNATPEVSGIQQMAEVTVLIYSDPSSDQTNVNWTYTMKCTGNKKWEFVERNIK